MSSESFQQRAADLRRRAEVRLMAVEAQTGAPPAPEEAQRLLHELRVHQIELEMQNEELRRAQAALEGLAARYFDLYHRAPVGYLTLSEKGLILEANLRAAALLGLPIETLVKRTLGRFIHPGDAGDYSLCTSQLWRTGAPQNCAVRLAPRREGAAPTWVRLEMVLAQDEQERTTVCRVILADISSHKRVETALQEREERQELILDHLSVGVALADSAGTTFYLNSAFTELFGYTLAQIPTLADWWRLAHSEPADREPIVAEWNRRLAEALASRGEIRPMEVAVTCADGAQKHVRITARVIGEHLFVTFIDLTERRAAEDALRVSENRYRDLYENAPVAYFSVGTDGRIRRCNRQAAQLLGAAVEQLVGRPVFDLYPDNPNGKTKARQVFERFLAGEPVADKELQMVRADGTPFWINLSVTAIRDAAGQVLESRSAVVDITDRKRAEEALRVSEERYRMLLMLSPDGISVADQTGRILACNEQFAAMHGFDGSAQAVGTSAQELASPEAFAGLYREVAAALKRGEGAVHDIEVEVLRRDGSRFPAEYSIAQVPWPDAPFGVAYLSNIRDITRRKEQAAELEQRWLRLEELVQARTRDLQAEIAQRAAAQAALQRSEAGLAAAERIAHIGSWERDLRTGEIHLSDGLYHILGLDPALAPEAAHAAAWDAVHPDDAAPVQAAIARAEASGAPLDLIFRIVRPAGEMIILRMVAEFEHDADGRPVLMRATAQDITEQEHNKEKLAKRIEELTSLQDLGQKVSLALPLKDIIQTYLDRLLVLADLDLAQVFLLREGRLHLEGRSSALTCLAALESLAVGECLCGQAVQEDRILYAPEVGCDLRCTNQHCQANGLHAVAALPLRSNQAIIGVLAVGAVAPDALAERLIFLETAANLIATRLQNALLHDEVQVRAAALEETVIERTRELQIERDRTQAILETVGESVVVTDLDGQILFVNPATTALTGRARAQELGRLLWQGWTPQARAEIWPAALAAVCAGRSWHGEIGGIREDGAAYIAGLTGTPLYDAAAPTVPIGAVWVQRDITQAKEAERLKDQFVSNVSHELRTPVSIIGLNCDSLEAYYDRMDEGRRKGILRDIHEQAHVLKKLIEDILTASQIDGGRLPQQKTRVDLARLVQEEAARQQPLAEKRSQQLSVITAPPVAVLGHEGQLRQVVRNLLDNAIKYTPAGGRIRCACEAQAGGSARTLDAGLPAAESWAVVEVHDNGVGIAAQELPFVFERFYRAASEGNIPGTGLGLSIAQELAHLHGGRIMVTSTPDQGSTFTVYLPLAGEE